MLHLEEGGATVPVGLQTTILTCFIVKHCTAVVM